jgi:hypothetical protein
MRTEPAQLSGVTPCLNWPSAVRDGQQTLADLGVREHDVDALVRLEVRFQAASEPDSGRGPPSHARHRGGPGVAEVHGPGGRSNDGPVGGIHAHLRGRVRGVGPVRSDLHRGVRDGQGHLGCRRRTGIDSPAALPVGHDEGPVDGPAPFTGVDDGDGDPRHRRRCEVDEDDRAGLNEAESVTIGVDDTWAQGKHRIVRVGVEELQIDSVDLEVGVCQAGDVDDRVEGLRVFSDQHRCGFRGHPCGPAELGQSRVCVEAQPGGERDWHRVLQPWQRCLLSGGHGHRHGGTGCRAGHAGSEASHGVGCRRQGRLARAGRSDREDPEHQGCRGRESAADESASPPGLAGPSPGGRSQVPLRDVARHAVEKCAQVIGHR